MSQNNEFQLYRQPYRHNGRYYNSPDEVQRSHVVPPLTVLCEWYWNTLRRGGCNSSYWYAPEVPLSMSEELAITWIGHSTFLIQVAGINIVTDPIFGHLPFFRRQIKPGIALQDMPRIDYVLISHNHLDHMNRAALNFFKEHPQCRFLVPLGDKGWFDARNFSSVHEYTWWQQDTFKHPHGEVDVTFLPAHHWSQRGLFDFNTSLWGSFMIQVAGHTIYFAGDTAYAGHFSLIKKEYSRIDHALIPIGPCEPRDWMADTHINAEEAGQAFLDLDAHNLYPMHWGTFRFGTDAHDAPYERLMSWWHKQRLPHDKQLTVLKVGQRATYDTFVPPATTLLEQEL